MTGEEISLENHMAMKVLFAAVEMAPFAKVGGLADVIGALPPAIKNLGIDTRIVLPDYALIRNSGRYKTKLIIEDWPVKINPYWTKMMNVWELEGFDVPVYLIDTDEWFHEADRSETIYRIGIDQYLFFSEAVLQLTKALNWKPDVIHCHDWHTGFIPVLMREKHQEDFDSVASFYTIHNLAYQGEFDIDILDKLGLPHSLFNSHQVEAWGRVNFLKSGAAYADSVSTVSETYAKEIQTSSFGCSLDGLMIYLHQQGRLLGILNGIDTSTFNPETDPDIRYHYSSQNLNGKHQCKQDLLKILNWKGQAEKPLLGMVSRISGQKGHRLVIESAHALQQLGVQIVILGSGEPALVEALHQLSKEMPDTFNFVEGFHETLAPKIYAGCDGFLMPSIFEPCGLGQMIAMRYGTVPIARLTGGLADTVFENINGFTFLNANATELSSALNRFVQSYTQRPKFEKIMQTGMNADFSWLNSAQKYVEAYNVACEGRQKYSKSA